MSAEPWPEEIRVAKDRRSLAVAWDDGRRDAIPAELLRIESPSAEVQGHHEGQKTLVAGKRAVTIAAAEPVGAYAVRLVFSDGHSTGLYTWPILRRLGAEQDAMMAAYLAKLAAAGQSRE
ncbi:MAG TPA: gamma-butyrobetaine hydroxylase-like domain-containing protein [Hyphomicrobiales bacterium]|nr:gamma-butyrobetaine hydroxylase-like domain-containing protein [Hyphomicrobiales bacterium]